MSDEGEKTVDRLAASDATTAQDRGDRSVDDAADSFLDLEAQLHGTPGSIVRARAVDVAKILGEAVPPEYPVDITTDEALALTLAVDAAHGREVTVYFELDDGRSDDRLGRLLALYDIPQHRFADLHGESLLIEYRDGGYLPYVPEESVRGSRRGVYGVAAGLGVNLLAMGLVGLGFGSVFSSLGAVVFLLAVNLLLLPVATYFDGWYLRTQTDWGQGPAFWALLAMVPAVNLVSVPLYLRARQRATPLVD